MIRDRKEFGTLSRNCSTSQLRHRGENCSSTTGMHQYSQTWKHCGSSHSTDAAFGRRWSWRPQVRELSVAHKDGVFDTTADFLGTRIVCRWAGYSMFCCRFMRVKFRTATLVLRLGGERWHSPCRGPGRLSPYHARLFARTMAC